MEGENATPAPAPVAVEEKPASTDTTVSQNGGQTVGKVEHVEEKPETLEKEVSEKESAAEESKPASEPKSDEVVNGGGSVGDEAKEAAVKEEDVVPETPVAEEKPAEEAQLVGELGNGEKAAEAENDETDLSVGGTDSEEYEDVDDGDEDADDEGGAPEAPRKGKRGRGASRYYTGKSTMDDVLAGTEDDDDAGGGGDVVAVEEDGDGDYRRNQSYDDEDEEDEDAEHLRGRRRSDSLEGEDGGGDGDGGDDDDERRGESKKDKVDVDEDRRKPQYIPKSGPFYQHDTRNDEEGEAPKDDKKDEGKKRGRVIPDRWTHDKFDASSQAPKSTEELVAQYGYDIRSDEGPPKAHRQRKYGRGPAKYDRNWEDGEAYRKAVRGAPARGGRGGMRGGDFGERGRGRGGGGGRGRDYYNDREPRSGPGRNPRRDSAENNDGEEVQEKRSWPTPEEAQTQGGGGGGGGGGGKSASRRGGRAENEGGRPSRSNEQRNAHPNSERTNAQQREQRQDRPRPRQDRFPRNHEDDRDQEYGGQGRVFVRGGRGGGPRGGTRDRPGGGGGPPSPTRHRRDGGPGSGGGGFGGNNLGRDKSSVRPAGDGGDYRGGRGGGRGGRGIGGGGRGGGFDRGAPQSQGPPRNQADLPPRMKQDFNRPPRYSSQRSSRAAAAGEEGVAPVNNDAYYAQGDRTSTAAVTTAAGTEAIYVTGAQVSPSSRAMGGVTSPAFAGASPTAGVRPPAGVVAAAAAAYSSPPPPPVSVALAAAAAAAGLLPPPPPPCTTAPPTAAGVYVPPPAPYIAAPLVYPAVPPPGAAAPFACPPPAAIFPGYPPPPVAGAPVAVAVTPPVGADPGAGQEIYSNGMTYYDTHAQVLAPRPIHKRPKAAIPIVAPPGADAGGGGDGLARVDERTDPSLTKEAQHEDED